MSAQAEAPAGYDLVRQARLDAIELAAVVREADVDGTAAHLSRLDAGRKDALLVALACAVDVDQTTRQWWGWLDAPLPASRRSPVRPVPLVTEVRRFARQHCLTDDQVWQAIINLHAAPGQLR